MFRPILLALVLALVSTPSLAADTLVSTFGPGDSFSATRPPLSGSSTFFGYTARGMRFTVGLERALTQVELALRHGTGANAYTIALFTDVAGQPGATLESWTTAAATSPSVLSLSSTTRPLLSAGGTYWLTASASGSNTSGGWFVNDQGIATGGAFLRTSPAGSWSSAATNDLAFRLTGTAAPEPTSLLFFLAGLVFVRKKIPQVR